MKHEEKKKDEGPKFDERGEPLVIFKRTCPAMNNAVFAAMRAMSDEDFKAGRGLTFQTMVREDPRYPARQIQFVFGIRPRTARTYAEMEAEAVEVINAAHKKFYAAGKR